VRDRFVTAVARMLVRRVMFCAAVPARTAVGILCRRSDCVLVYVLIVYVMQVSIMHVVGVVVVFDGSMSAPGTVLVVVCFVSRVCHRR